MNYELSGEVKLVMEPKTFASGFTVREFVVTVKGGKYDQDIILQVVQDKVELLDDVGAGDEVTAAFDIRGKEYNGRYFNNLQAWKVEVHGGAHGKPPVEGVEPGTSSGAPAAEDEFEDDIPF